MSRGHNRWRQHSTPSKYSTLIEQDLLCWTAGRFFTPRHLKTNPIKLRLSYEQISSDIQRYRDTSIFEWDHIDALRENQSIKIRRAVEFCTENETLKLIKFFKLDCAMCSSEGIRV